MKIISIFRKQRKKMRKLKTYVLFFFKTSFQNQYTILLPHLIIILFTLFYLNFQKNLNQVKLKNSYSLTSLCFLSDKLLDILPSIKQQYTALKWVTEDDRTVIFPVSLVKKSQFFNLSMFRFVRLRARVNQTRFKSIIFLDIPRVFLI